MKLSSIAAVEWWGETTIYLVAEYPYFVWCFGTEKTLLYATSELEDADRFMFCHWGLDYGA